MGEVGRYTGCGAPGVVHWRAHAHAGTLWSLLDETRVIVRTRSLPTHKMPGVCAGEVYLLPCLPWAERWSEEPTGRGTKLADGSRQRRQSEGLEPNQAAGNGAPQPLRAAGCLPVVVAAGKRNGGRCNQGEQLCSSHMCRPGCDAIQASKDGLTSLQKQAGSLMQPQLSRT